MILSLIIFIVCLLASPSLVIAQEAPASASAAATCAVDPASPNGVISGVVSDPQGAVVPGATVDATCGATRRTSTTDTGGRFRLTLPAGGYWLRVTLAGFAPTDRGVVVTPAGTLDLPVTLAVGGLTDSVQVGAVALVASTSRAATKADIPLLEAAQAVSVVTREEMDVRGVQTVTEAVRYTSGVQSEALNGNDSRMDDMQIRGFDAGGFSNNVYLDGMRLPSGGGWTKPRFDAFGLERVDVVKGPSAALYGQVAPGGLVSMTSKMPTLVRRGEVTLQSGSFGQWRGMFDSSGSLAANGRLAYRVAAVANDGGSQVDYTDVGRALVAPSLTWRPGDSTSLTVLSQYQKDFGGSTFQFLPYSGSAVPTAFGTIARNAFLGERDFNTFDRTQWAVGYQFEHRFRPALAVRQSLRVIGVDTLYQSAVSAGNTLADGRTMRRRAVEGVGDSDGFTVDTQVPFTATTGPLRHSVIAGVDYNRTDWRSLRTLAATVPSIDIFAPVYSGRAAMGPFAPQVWQSAVNQQVGVYAQDHVSVGPLRLTLGGRRDSSTDTVLNRINNATTVIDADPFTGAPG